MNNYVLWLASWYPSRVQPSNGDFVERQARAISPYIPIIVLLVEKDEQLPRGETASEKIVEPGLIVFKVYYGASSSIRSIEKLISFLTHRKLQRRWYRLIVSEFGKPGLVHVHMAMKAGLLALDILKKSGIPFLLTEHWTGYYKTSIPNFYDAGLVMQRLTKKVIQKASLLFTVSDDLGRTIQQNIANVNYQVLPNVVDTVHFNCLEVAPAKFRFIHASYLNYQKNPEAMIEAASILFRQGYVFELVLLGNRDKNLEALARERGLLDVCVFIKSAVSYVDVSVQMKQSSALLMFSRFENLPCVILEALCCGLPVISSRVGGIAEVIDEKNGLLVSKDSLGELIVNMKKMMDNFSSYNRVAISADASKKYSYSVVGAQYFEWYKKFFRSM